MPHRVVVGSPQPRVVEDDMMRAHLVRARVRVRVRFRVRVSVRVRVRSSQRTPIAWPCS